MLAEDRQMDVSQNTHYIAVAGDQKLYPLHFTWYSLHSLTGLLHVTKYIRMLLSEMNKIFYSTSVAIVYQKTDWCLCLQFIWKTVRI